MSADDRFDHPNCRCSTDELEPLGQGIETRYYSNGWIKISSMANREEQWLATDTPEEIQQ